MGRCGSLGGVGGVPPGLHCPPSFLALGLSAPRGAWPSRDWRQKALALAGPPWGLPWPPMGSGPVSGALVLQDGLEDRSLDGLPAWGAPGVQRATTEPPPPGGPSLSDSVCTDLWSPPPHPRRAQASDTSGPACLGLPAWGAEFIPGVASTAPETRGIEEVKQERKHYLGTLTLDPELGKLAGQGPSAESARGPGQGSGCRCGGPCGEAGGAGVGAAGRQRAGRPVAAPLARPGGDLAPLLQALNRLLAPSWRR